MWRGGHLSKLQPEVGNDYLELHIIQNSVRLIINTREDRNRHRKEMECMFVMS
jgi:hypothetical protein